MAVKLKGKSRAAIISKSNNFVFRKYRQPTISAIDTTNVPENLPAGVLLV